jgi:hypothetical protein
MFGELGKLALDPVDGKVQCHICGKWFLTLGTHCKIHGMTPKEYREEFQLNSTCHLTSPEFSERKRLTGIITLSKCWANNSFNELCVRNRNESLKKPCRLQCRMNRSKSQKEHSAFHDNEVQKKALATKMRPENRTKASERARHRVYETILRPDVLQKRKDKAKGTVLHENNQA